MRERKSGQFLRVAKCQTRRKNRIASYGLPPRVALRRFLAARRICNDGEFNQRGVVVLHRKADSGSFPAASSPGIIRPVTDDTTSPLVGGRKLLRRNVDATEITGPNAVGTGRDDEYITVLIKNLPYLRLTYRPREPRYDLSEISYTSGFRGFVTRLSDDRGGTVSSPYVIVM